MFDIFNEIGDSLRRNKLRTLLTGFSVVWGIFLLILLLAVGNGFKKGVNDNFASQNINTLEIWAGRTSKPYGGYQRWRQIKLDQNDSLFLSEGFEEIGTVAPTFSVGYKTGYYGEHKRQFNVTAVIAEYLSMNAIKLSNGRFINDKDLKERRKVIILCKKDADLLFGKEDPIGKTLNVEDLNYTVIGIYSNENMSWQTSAYIPYTTAARIYNLSDIREFFCTLNGLTTEQSNKDFIDNMRFRFSKKHNYDPTDTRAVGMWNQLEDYVRTQRIFSAITLFLWIIGISTLIAGVVGISNIMLITVRERTKEFGIRKALGAKPRSIIQLIITESLIITTLFGYVGMVLGIVITEVLGKLMPASQTGDGGMRMNVFKDPSVDFNIVIGATLVMIIAGAIAGYFPARKAVKIKPIEALRYE